MATPTPTSVKAILVAGLPFTIEEITADRIFINEQPENRRKYPSIEVLEAEGQEGYTNTQDKEEHEKKFVIRLFVRLVGQLTDEVPDIGTVEDEILDLVSNATLGDHKIISESKIWSRKPQVGRINAYSLSILTITISRVTLPAGTQDGVLVFDLSESSVDNPPGSDYTYANVFDVTMSSGYGDEDEFVANNSNPNRYTTGFNGTFIGSVRVDKADIGSTGEKLNKLNTVKNNGEKPVCGFIYTNKDGNTTPNTLTKAIKMTVDEVQEQYSDRDVVIFRVLGKLLQPTITS